MVEVPQTGGNLQQMATVLIEAFTDRRVELYEDSDLRRDLRRFRVEERSYGFRLTSPRDEYGHGDLGSAFSHAMLAASELAATPIEVAGVWGSSLPDERFSGEHELLRNRELWTRGIHPGNGSKLNFLNPMSYPKGDYQ